MALPARNVELLRLLLADDVGSGCGLRGCRLWGLGVQGFFGLGFRVWALGRFRVMWDVPLFPRCESSEALQRRP